jgi:hypothetical protein
VSGQRVGDWHRLETGRTECFDKLAGFHPCKGACGVEKVAACLYSGSRVGKRSRLKFRQFAQVIRGCRPTSVGIPLPRSYSAAWRVHEYNVEKGFGWELETAIPELRAIVEDTGASGAALENLQTPLGSVTRPNQSFILHQI